MSLGCDEDCQRCGTLSLQLPTIISLRFLSCCEESEVWRDNLNGKVLSQLSFIQKTFTFGECDLGISWVLRILPPCVDYLSTLFLNPGGVFKENLLSGSLPLLSPRSNLTLICSFCVSANWTNFRQIWESLNDARGESGWLTLTSIKRWKPNYQEIIKGKVSVFVETCNAIQPKKSWITIRK